MGVRLRIGVRAGPVGEATTAWALRWRMDHPALITEDRVIHRPECPDADGRKLEAGEVIALSLAPVRCARCYPSYIVVHDAERGVDRPLERPTPRRAFRRDGAFISATTRLQTTRTATS